MTATTVAFVVGLCLVPLPSRATVTLLTPTREHLMGCREARCVPLSPNARVCKCSTEERADFILESGGHTVSTWDAGHPDNGAFFARAVDLDDDGNEELVLENLDDVGNGMAVSHWTIAVLDTRFSSPLLFGASDWAGGCLNTAAGGRSTLLATAWNWSSEPGRGGGLYFVGRSFSYANGMLVPTLEVPVTARRYLFSFERERGRTLDSGKDVPVRWLRHPSAQPRERDPSLPSQPPTVEAHGTIVGVRGSRDVECWRIDVETDSGHQTVEYPHCGREGGSRTAIDAIADQASGRVFPDGYIPADPRRLVGRPATLSTYREDDCPGEPCGAMAVLWIGVLAP